MARDLHQPLPPPLLDHPSHFPRLVGMPSRPILKYARQHHILTLTTLHGELHRR
ncbi:hypothetical protein IF1G_09874 [Cordyceps javanica]|uniref:Uncharacterized protein n=1 Tax=Cordyceps javanica TaxID=43265 RepID=A0A545UPI4_9HYPO|nr:hypothetical protein IF1G_09874 [Cordyceps javanica]